MPENLNVLMSACCFNCSKQQGILYYCFSLSLCFFCCREKLVSHNEQNPSVNIRSGETLPWSDWLKSSILSTATGINFPGVVLNDMVWEQSLENIKNIELQEVLLFWCKCFLRIFLLFEVLRILLYSIIRTQKSW